jgi:hypothetical protein
MGRAALASVAWSEGNEGLKESVTMATTAEQLEQLLSLMREVDLSTLLALDRELHFLLAQKGKATLRTRPGTSVQEEFSQRYPHIAVDPALFALVGVHPESPVEEDKTFIRESISRRFTD